MERPAYDEPMMMICFAGGVELAMARGRLQSAGKGYIRVGSGFRL